MTRHAVSIALAIAALAATARADDVEVPDPAVMERIRELYAHRDYEGVRRELLAEHARTHHPSLLFALGQVELSLENYGAAIERYEQFIATEPGEAQISLAQQAIGAARMRMAQPRPSPQPPAPVPVRRHRAWYLQDTVLVSAGGVAIAVGGGLVLYGRSRGNDRSGSLMAYDDRVHGARALQWSGVAVASVGFIISAATVVRWRLRPDDGELAITASASGAAASVSWPW